jgi:ubiquinone/menaquinone biosynthesis C-methylase UbiE
VAAGALAAGWAARRHVADALTERQARRPAGALARRFYGERRGYQASFQQTLDALELSHEDRLLEIGPGGGLFLELALRRCGSVTAIDHSPDMLRLARQRNADAARQGRLRLVEGDATRLPFPDGEFTAAAMIDVFLVLEHPDAVLAELQRVLTARGRVAIHTRTPETSRVMRRIGLGWMARRLRFYDEDELAAALAHAGFPGAVVERVDHGYAQLATASKRA